jgi:nitrous oxidase accessory protein
MRIIDELHVSVLRRLAIAVLVFACVAVAWKYPLWNMKLIAPMYPKGLYMTAYGDSITGDLNEINILNHYVGMRHIKPDEITIMAIYPFGLALVFLITLVALFKPSWHRLCAIFTIFFPLAILATIQYYLYTFGHGLNPDAPIKVPEFTPKVLGSSTIVNFSAHAMISWGLVALLVIPLILWFGTTVFSPARHKRVKIARLAPTVFVVLLVLACSARAGTLQTMINNAAAGSTIRVPAGTYQGNITISKPLTLIAEAGARIFGDARGDVVTISSDHVTLSGFLISYSGKEVSEDAAGIRSQGDAVTISNNEITNVYFGIHILQSDGVTISSNYIHPGAEYAGRPGHAVNIWSVHSIIVKNNQIEDARDGILLTYADNVTVNDNHITRCRYGLHSMYGRNITFTGNTVRDNLLGLALMYSKVLVARGNTITEQRRGTSPYGFLLKDVDNLTLENNLIEANQVGIFTEGISMAYGSSSKIIGNMIVGNICGLSLQSNATFLFTGNCVLENLTDVNEQTDHINSGVRWSENGKGNYWSNYRGYDKNNDHIGDIPYRVEKIAELEIDESSPAQGLLFTPGYLVLESAIQMFPIFKGDPVLEDRSPLTAAPSDLHQAHDHNTWSPVFSSLSALLFISGSIGIARYKPFDKN